MRKLFGFFIVSLAWDADWNEPESGILFFFFRFINLFEVQTTFINQTEVATTSVTATVSTIPIMTKQFKNSKTGSSLFWCQKWYQSNK